MKKILCIVAMFLAMSVFAVDTAAEVNECDVLRAECISPDYSEEPKKRVKK